MAMAWLAYGFAWSLLIGFLLLVVGQEIRSQVSRLRRLKAFRVFEEPSQISSSLSDDSHRKFNQ